MAASKILCCFSMACAKLQVAHAQTAVGIALAQSDESPIVLLWDSGSVSYACVLGQAWALP
eukprot:scaffold198465_cov18-Tisochrysis_lutea.AAC.1